MAHRRPRQTDEKAAPGMAAERDRHMNLRRNLACSILLLLCLSLAACSGSLWRNYGRILPSDEAERDMDGGLFHQEYRYYTSGSDLYPNALIGLHRGYQLHRDALWKEVAMSPAKLRETVGFMKAKAAEYHQYPRGFDLIDTQGRKIGIWYAILQARTFLRFEEDGSVMIHTPDLETYEKLEARDNND